jgi:hypothetical protein
VILVVRVPEIKNVRSLGDEQLSSICHFDPLIDGRSARKKIERRVSRSVS